MTTPSGTPHPWCGPIYAACHVLGYAYSPPPCPRDPPPTTVDAAGRPFPLDTANVSRAVLTAQAHELVTRSALRDVLVVLPLMPAPQDALLAVHAPAYLERLREASAGGSWDGEYAPVTPATWDAARLTAGGLVRRGRRPSRLVPLPPSSSARERCSRCAVGLRGAAVRASRPAWSCEWDAA